MGKVVKYFSSLPPFSQFIWHARTRLKLRTWVRACQIVQTGSSCLRDHQVARRRNK